MPIALKVRVVAHPTAKGRGRGPDELGEVADRLGIEPIQGVQSRQVCSI